MVLVAWLDGPAEAAEPIEMRIESLTLPPAHGPLIVVDVRAPHAPPGSKHEGSFTVKVPEGWVMSSSQQTASWIGDATARVKFAVQRGVGRDDGVYPIEIAATVDGVTSIHRQNVLCATAPYFKPTIDGEAGEWKDALPVAWVSGGKKTTVSSYWNRRELALLVAVEEDALVGYRAGPFDAVQVAVSPQDSVTGESPQSAAGRFEFLLASTGNGTEGKVFQLAGPETRLAETQAERVLEPLECRQARLAVSRKGGTTWYECSLPFSPMQSQIRPSEGREFYLSVLVHDPDGTGLRDLGQAAGLTRRTAWAWSRWPGAAWGPQPPLDNKVEWGLCASKY